MKKARMNSATPGCAGLPRNGRRSCLTRAKISIPWRTGSLSMNIGDVYLAFFPYGDVPARKIRPVLLLTQPIGPIPELIGAYISSIMPTTLLPSDLIADPKDPDFASANLKKLSVLRLHKIAT